MTSETVKLLEENSETSYLTSVLAMIFFGYDTISTSKKSKNK